MRRLFTVHHITRIELMERHDLFVLSEKLRPLSLNGDLEVKKL